MRRVPGASNECSLSRQGESPIATRPYAQWLRGRGWSRTDCGDGNLPAAGRLDCSSERAAILCGGSEDDRKSDDGEPMTEDRCYWVIPLVGGCLSSSVVRSP